MSKEIEELRNDMEDAFVLIRSPEWKAYIKFLGSRAEALQVKVNTAVKNNDITLAQINLALMEDCSRHIVLFRKSIQDINEKIKKEREAIDGNG